MKIAGQITQRSWSRVSTMPIQSDFGTRQVFQDAVVLLHGLFATRRSMQKAEHRLRARGYRVINWGYSTLLRSVDSQVKSLLATIETLERNAEVRTINFLTHSFGGIMARYAMELHKFQKLHRMVMLAPPNRGSHLTKYSLGPFARFLPAIAELSNSSDSLTNRLPCNPNIDVGIIAASHDFIVKVANTTLPTQSDHCTVRGTHFQLPYMDDVLSMAIEFLSHGSFRIGARSELKRAG